MKKVFTKFVATGIFFVCLFMISNHSNAQNCTVNAGVFQEWCETEEIRLFGIISGLPITSSRFWTQVSGPTVDIINPTALVPTIVGAQGGQTYRFRLTTRCVDGSLIFDEVEIGVLDAPTTNAGSDIALQCPGSGSLNAESLGTNESGIWTVTGAEGVVNIAEPNNPNSPITFTTQGGLTTLRWTVTNTVTGCTAFDEITVEGCGGDPNISASPFPSISLGNCYGGTTGTVLEASDPGLLCGQGGLWTAVSGPNVPTFSNPNSPTSVVTNLIPGTYVLRWTVSGPCVNGEDEVTIIVPEPLGQGATSAEIVNPTRIYCDSRTETILQGSVPGQPGETVQWVQTGGSPMVTIESPTSPSTVISGLDRNGGPYTFSYTITNPNGCVGTTSATISYSEPLEINALESVITLTCQEVTASIEFSEAGNGTTEWRLLSAPSGITAPTPFSSTGSSPLELPIFTETGNYVIELRRSAEPDFTCEAVTDQVTVVASRLGARANAGTDQLLACNVFETELAGNNPLSTGIGVGTWTQLSGPNQATFEDINAFDSEITDLVPGTYVFRWVISGGPFCFPNQDEVLVRVADAIPDAANAGIDQTVCTNSPIFLNANEPILNEIGTWSISPDQGDVFSDENDPNAFIIEGLDPGLYTFTWTVENSCGSLSDNITVEVLGDVGPQFADAGEDICDLTGTTSLILDANEVDDGEIGTWSQVGTTPSIADFDNPNEHNTEVSNLVIGTYTFVWTIDTDPTIGACVESTDTLIVTLGTSIASVDAGPDQNVCLSGPGAPEPDTVFFQADTFPAGTLGIWSQISGNAGFTIIDVNDPESGIVGLTDGAYSFEWTITDGACILSRDTVSLYISTEPEEAVAGTDQTICAPTPVSLSANSVENGFWTVVSGPNSPTFSDFTDPDTELSNLLMGTYRLAWNSVSEPFCPISSDTIEIVFTPSASVGPDAGYCEGSTTYNLIGNPQSIGVWTLEGQPMGAAVTITPTSNNTATASGMTVNGVYRFRYTIDGGGGCESFDEFEITLFGQPNDADAGSDQLLCNVLSIDLAGNDPDPGFDGIWTQVSGPTGVTFSQNASDPGATANLPEPGIYVFRWTISNGDCTSSDQVTIVVADDVGADAGADILEVCTDQVNLNAVPVSNAVGNWTFISGPVTPIIQNPVLPNTLVSGLTAQGDYIFEWEVSTTNDICASSTDQVTVTVELPATEADAGMDQILCEGTSVTLAANDTLPGEIGLWSIVSQPIGGMANIIDPNDPNTEVTGLGILGTYQFEWTISRGVCETSDTVTIENLDIPVADAGQDTSICIFEPVFLNANTPPATGSGLWTQVSGSSVNIISPSNPNTQILGIPGPGVYEFQWAVNNPPCAPATDNVTITIEPQPAQARIQSGNKFICGSIPTALLVRADSINIGDNGTWSQLSGPGTLVFSPDNAITTVISGFAIPAQNTVDTVWIQWEVENSTGLCTSVDSVMIFIYGEPLDAIINTLHEEFCDVTSFDLEAQAVSTPSFGYWLRIGPPGGSLVSPFSPSTTYNNPGFGTYEFRWITVNGTCFDQDTVFLTNFEVLDGGQGDIEICIDGEPVLEANASGGNGNYTYQWQVSDTDCGGTWTDIVGETGSTYQVPSSATNSLGEIFYRVIINDDGPCDEFISDCITITIVDDPQIDIQPTNPDPICTGGSASFSVTAVPNTGTPAIIYQWQYNNGGTWQNVSNGTPTGFSYSGGGTNSTLNVTTTNASPTGIFEYKVIVDATGIGCDPETSDVVELEVFENPSITTQPEGAEICPGETHEMTIAAMGNIPPGDIDILWEQRSPPGSGAWSNADGTNDEFTYTTAALIESTEFRAVITQINSGCETISDEVTVQVNPSPIVTSPSTMTICSGQSVNYSPTSNIPGTTFEWTAVNTVGTVTGFSTSGSGDINDVLTNVGSTNGQVVYTIIPVGPGVAECGGLPFLFVVDVLDCVSSIGVSKQLSSLNVHSDGTATAVFNYVLKNYGNTFISNVTLEDNLDDAFGEDNYEVLSFISDDFITNSNYDGSMDTELLLLTGNTLDVNEVGLVTLSVRILSPGNYTNQATARGETPEGPIEDDSQDGPDPDPDGDDDPTNNDDPTPSGYEINPLLGLAKNLSGLVNNGDGSWDVSYEFVVRNYGDVDVDSIMVRDTLSLTFPLPCEVEVVSLTSSNFSINPNFDGVTDFDLLLDGPPQTTTNTLDVGEEKNIHLTVRVDLCDTSGIFWNQATVYGKDPFDTPLEDLSQNGTDPDPDGDGDPTNNDAPTPVEFIEEPYLGLAKRLLNTPTNNGDGTYTFTFEFRVVNRGNIIINESTPKSPFSTKLL